MLSSSLGLLQFGCLVYLSHHQEGFSRRGIWKVGIMLWILAWINQSFSCPSTPFCGSGDTKGLAREESPLAGTLRCPSGNNREYPCHCHPFLHGHEGMCPAWAPFLRPRSSDSVWSSQCDCWSRFQISTMCLCFCFQVLHVLGGVE